MKRLTLLLLAAMPAMAATPALHYSDLVNGMCTGGKNNRGHIITISGRNFGSAADATHYVTLTSGGDSQNAAAYILWSDTQIAFQPGCTFADGTDTTITVTTPDGTSNTLPFRIYTGASIYFADQGTVTGVTGSDSNNGTSPSTPFLTLAKCTTMAYASPGNACYLMPGFVQSTSGTTQGGAPGYLSVNDLAGTASKHIAVIGYPSSTHSQVAQLAGASKIIAIRMRRSKYITIANLRIGSYDTGGYEQVEIGGYGNNANHHIRLINLDLSMVIESAVMSIQMVNSSYITLYGGWTHDITFPVTGGKHTGHIYIGQSSHDIDIGWWHFDGSCSFSETPCLDGKQNEVHTTNIGDWMPAPSQPTVTATSGGTLAAGTYDISVSYGSQIYNFASHSYGPTETLPSTTRSVVLNGTTQTAIQITHPPGFQRWSTRDDGDTIACNPSLNYKVYACLRSSPGTPCTSGQFQLQGTSNYSGLDIYDGIDGADYTVSSLASGAAPLSGANGTANVAACNTYNVAIHDNLYEDAPDYAVPLGANIDANPPHYLRFYNNTVVNGGNGANPPGGDNSSFDAVCMNLMAPDITNQEPQGGTVDIFNNTFFNCGNFLSYWHESLGVFGVNDYEWYDGWPSLTWKIRNNIFYQPQANQQMIDARYPWDHPNFQLAGSNNLCYAPNNTDHGVCPAKFNTGGGGLNADPLFVSTGTRHDPGTGGGPYWDGLNLALAPGSPAIGAGVDLGLGTNIGATNALYQAPTVTCAITTTTLPGATVGTAYSQTLAQTGCSASSWTGFTATDACSGLSLNSSTGVLSGTPTTAGTCSFTAAYDTDTQALSIAVSAAPVGGSGGTLTGVSTGIIR